MLDAVASPYGDSGHGPNTLVEEHLPQRSPGVCRCGWDSPAIESETWTDTIKGLAKTLLVELDPYDPRKPEYIIPMSPEQQEEECWSTTLRQILRLENALARRRAGNEECCPEIVTHYESVLEELKRAAEASQHRMKLHRKLGNQATELIVPMAACDIRPSEASTELMHEAKAPFELIPEDTEYLGDRLCNTFQAVVGFKQAMSNARGWHM